MTRAQTPVVDHKGVVATDAMLDQPLELEDLLCNAVSDVLKIVEFECGNVFLIDELGQVNRSIQCGELANYAPDMPALEQVVEALWDTLPGLPPVFNIPSHLNFFSGSKEKAKSDNSDVITHILAPKARAHSHYIVTLQGKRRVVGVISLYDRDKHSVSEEEASILAVIGRQIGVAVENAQLYIASEQQVGELQAAYERLQRVQEEQVRIKRLAAIDQVAATVSHEINNPLTVALGNIERLLTTTQTLSAENREGLQQIAEATFRIRDVVRKLNKINDRPVPYMGQTMMIDIHSDDEQDEAVRLYEQIERELVEHRQAERKLREINKELENQIAQRTAELTRINAELVREIKEREGAEERLLQRNRELLFLHSASAAANASLDLQFVLETVSWEMANLLKIEGCVIYEWNEETDAVSVIAEYDAADREGKTMMGQTYDLADSPLRERVLAERYAQQTTISQPDINPAELAYMQGADIKTLLILPMVFQNRVLGLAEMHDSRVERVFTDREISLAQFLTTQAASAVENARLYERAQREIKERIRVEEQIKASLEEKEVLLKEVHHRVKNNLQVISSMLNLQARNVEDPLTLRVLQESQSRIQSMALVHERLYRSQDLAQIDFGVYIRDLAAHLVRSYGANLERVDLKVDVDGIFLDIDTAIACGLIVNELICNSLKYAFPDGGAGEVCVEIHSDHKDQLTMVVSDNGVGLPKDIDIWNTGSLGLQLVSALTRQLEGSLELCSDGGTEFKLTFATP